MGSGTDKAKQRVRKVVQLIAKPMEKFGGGQKEVDKLMQKMDQFEKAKLDMTAGKAFKAQEEAHEKLVARAAKWKNPNSTRNQNRIKNSEKELKELEGKAITQGQKVGELETNLRKVEQQSIKDAHRQVRNKGLKRLGLVGTTGLGTYNYFNQDPSTEAEEAKQTPSKYRFDPNEGWQEYNEETRQYEAQKPGFGVDRFGNTNYYNGANWLTPDQYIQGSNGVVYDKTTGQIIGNSDDLLEARNSGYDDVFAYRAAQAGFTSPEQIMALQQQLGVTADGKWGMQTQNAYEAAQNAKSPYNISNLFTMYQRRA